MLGRGLEQVLGADGRHLFLLDLARDSVEDLDERVGDELELGHAVHEVVAGLLQVFGLRFS